ICNLFVLSGHRVLRCVRNDDDKEHIGNSERSHVAPQDEAEGEDKPEIHDRSSYNQLQRGECELKQRTQPDLADDSSCGLSFKSPTSTQKWRTRRLRLLIPTRCRTTPRTSV